MVRFYGKTGGKLDDKGRVVFPAVFRDAMTRSGESDTTLIIKKSVHGNCLDLYTLDEWVKRSDKVMETLDTELNPEHAAFWSKFNDEVYQVVPDGKLGRINIPEVLLKATGLTKEVVFAGVGYKIEIWDRERREASLISESDFKKTAAGLSEKKQ
ncbi:MAG: hypothetical protein IJR77_03130 [Bacteroidales bacterium]|nr:hypothetical protein [Bacteroidales bacterium]